MSSLHHLFTFFFFSPRGARNSRRLSPPGRRMQGQSDLRPIRFFRLMDVLRSATLRPHLPFSRCEPPSRSTLGSAGPIDHKTARQWPPWSTPLQTRVVVARLSCMSPLCTALVWLSSVVAVPHVVCCPSRNSSEATTAGGRRQAPPVIEPGARCVS